MKRIDGRLILGMGALAAAASTATLTLRNSKTAPLESAGRGLYTARQIVSLAEETCRRVIPERTMESFEAEYGLTYDTAHGSRKLWHVQCRNDLGAEVCFRWDAQSGRLLWASRSSPRAYRARRLLTVPDAERIAINWMHDLRMADAYSTWRVERAPQRNQCAWVVHLKEKDDRATVVIDALDGSLQYAEHWR